MDKELIHIIALKENQIYDLKEELEFYKAVRKSQANTITRLLNKIEKLEKDPLK